VPTYSEQQELALQFAGDLARMRRCLHAADKQVVDDDIVYAWAVYSNRLCAAWLTPPGSDETLLAILLEHLPAAGELGRPCRSTARDGSGDGILKLPEELAAQMGWKDGDTLTIIRDDLGGLTLRRLE